MKIIIINPILYTCETSFIKKVASIKDSMIYNLCLEFKRQGHIPVLIAAKDYEPYQKENYDFEVIFLETKWKRIFKPNCFPYLSGLKKYLKSNEFDRIISSEVFSINSLISSVFFKKKLIIWHELAKHNNILKKMPSKFWYSVIAKVFFHDTRIIARSKNARIFISKYCNNVSSQYIDHGVDLDKFVFSKNKKKQFVVVSQLIKRKHIDGIITSFMKFNEDYNDFKLIIIGSGEEEKNLKSIVNNSKQKNIVFMGQLSHSKIIPILSKSYALVVNTEKDNSMLSIVEAIACGTPIITTDIPYNCDYIKKNKLGIVTKTLNKNDFINISEDINLYVENCEKYHNKVSNEYHVKQFIKEFELL